MNRIVCFVLLCSVSLFVGGCSSFSSAGKNQPNEKALGQHVESPRLTESQALNLADEYVKENKRDFDLANYPDRKPRYKSDSQSWSILYHRSPNRWPGDHFMVVVDDLTKQVKLIGGR